MILTCTPSGPVRPRLKLHELLVVLAVFNIVTDDWYSILIFQWSLYDGDKYTEKKL